MSFDPFWIGRTAGRNTFVVDSWIAGSTSNARLLGHNRSGRAVQFGVMPEASVALTEITQKLSYEVEGIARCGFIGGFDRFSPKRSPIVLVEELGEGAPLLELLPLLAHDRRLLIAQKLAQTVQRAARQRVVLGGIRPDLIWLDVARPEAVTLFPRFYMLVAVRPVRRFVGAPPWPFADIGAFVDPTMLMRWDSTTASDVYCLGLVLAWLFTGQHPFAEGARRGWNPWLSLMEQDQRDPFHGPPEIGAILDRVLLADPEKRMPIDDVVAALEAIP